MSQRKYKVLVANRGEIAIRILRSARELGWSTVSVYTSGDASHTGYADDAVILEGVSDFMDASTIAAVAQRSQCTHVHPGYGFLSESPALCEALANCTPPITFVGPTQETLRVASDKMLSRDLATSLNVNVSPGTRVSSAADVLAFAHEAGYPVMIKALDGGGGRGIRVVLKEEEVEEALQRCLGESPSKQVFAEKALVGSGWKHIEVQIIGDGTGDVNHFWERECSVQRRFQKVIEIAPSRFPRTAVQALTNASCLMARSLKYRGLGTFEFLVNSQTNSWVFLEINPRVQVEHTITEEVVDLDLVRMQLLLFTPGTTLQSLSIHTPFAPPSSFAIQLRLTAEDPTKNFQLSPGTIRSSDLCWPAGRGVRIDTWLCHLDKWNVGTDFDSLLAKIIVCGKTFEEATQKGIRALQEFRLTGEVRVNLEVLAGVLGHGDWAEGSVDTMWLERNMESVSVIGKGALNVRNMKSLESEWNTRSGGRTLVKGNGTTTLQPGSLFNLTLAPRDDNTTSTSKHTIVLSSIKQNAFPDVLSGTLQASLVGIPLSFSLTQSTSASVSSSGEFELADPNNPTHVGCPLTGKVVELHPALTGAKGDRMVRKGEPIIILSVMKMENSVVAPKDGYVERSGKGVSVGRILGEGALVCVIEGSGVVSKL